MVNGIDRLEACPPNGKKQRPTAKGKKERPQAGSLPHGSRRSVRHGAKGKPLQYGRMGKAEGKGKRRRQKAFAKGIDWRNAARSTGVPAGNSTAASGCLSSNGMQYTATADGEGNGGQRRQRQWAQALRPYNGKKAKATAEGKRRRRTVMTNNRMIHQEVNIWEMAGWIVRG